jgi:hypothetical protein
MGGLNMTDFELLDIFEEKIYEAFPGISGLDISFSLSSCQGDGVSFTGTITSEENITAFLTEVYGIIPHKIKRVIPHIYSIDFERIDHHYTHPYTINTTITDQWNDYSHSRFLKLLEDIAKDVNEYRIGVCKNLENKGYNMLYEEEE